MPSSSPTLDLELAEAAYRLKRSAAETSAHDADWERYRADICAWIDECCWTHDGRKDDDGHVIGWLPFRLYDFQKDYLRWLEARYDERADTFTEKSRDMGASWCMIAWFVHHWMFEPGFHALVGSYTEALTDNFLLDSILGRAEKMIDHLPAWQQARIAWNPTHPECRKHKAMVNRANGNQLLGQAPSHRFGRGGRYSAMLLDEFSMWEHPEEALAASGEASPCRHFVATPLGMNASGRLRHSGRVKHYTLHWRLHPHKDDAWYTEKCATRTPEQIAQELDISYDRSVMGRVLPEWDRVPRGEYPYVQGWPTYVSWDFGLDDETALVWWQKNPATGMYRAVDCYSSRGKTIAFYAPFVSGQVPSGLPYDYSAEDIEKIQSHRGWGAATHYGDPAGAQRNQVTGSSVIDEMAKVRIYVNTRPDRNTFHERWQTTKLFLPRVEGWHAATCLPLHDALAAARFPERRLDSVNTTENAKPIHDWTSHYRTAVEFFAVNVYGLEEHRDQPKQAPQPSAWMLRETGGMTAARGWLNSRR